MSKKIVSLLLVLALCLSVVLPAAALPADVPEGAWYAEAASYVLDAGLMDEMAGGFAPKGELDLRTLLQSLVRLTEAEGEYDRALDAYGYSESEMRATVSRLELASRFYAQLASLDILYAEAALDRFADAASIPADAADQVRAVVGAGLIGGRTDGSLDLDTAANRAELAAVHYKISLLTNDKQAGTVALVDRYGNLTLDLFSQNLFNAGYALGDMLTISIGGREIDAPFCTSYSDVDTGNPVVRAAAGLGTSRVIIAINMGNFAETYAVTEGAPVSLKVKEAGAYFTEWEIRQLTRTNNREDYASDAIFANFRNVAIGASRKGNSTAAAAR